jgi:hypothetical protein
MIEPKFAYTSVMPDLNDAQYPDEPEPTPRPTYYDHDNDDDGDERPSSHRKKRYSIYEKYFTPEERKMLAAIPENDLSYEVNLLRALLVDTFALVPTGPKDKKPPLKPSFHYDLHTTLSRVCVIITRLASLHLKLNGSRNETAEIIRKTLCEMDPHDLCNYDDDDDVDSDPA